MDSRQTQLFDENVKTKHGMSQFKTYKSPLIDENGEIFGTCGIAHDVSDLQNIHRELNVVLESMPFGVIMEDRDKNIVSVNKKLSEIFPAVKDMVGMKYEDWKAKYFANSKPFINGGEKKEISLGGRNLTICLKEMNLQDSFGADIGRIVLFSDVTAEQEYTKNVEKRAGTDFLTKLNNRQSLFNHLNYLDESTILSMITIDLDNFKKVNDTYGHYVGDEALVTTSRVLLQSFSDDFVSRLGGDEFLVVISRSIGLEEVEEECEQFFCSLKVAFSERPEFKALSASIGIAYSEIKKGENQDIETVMKESDSDLYKAKHNGKNTICIYS